MERKGTFIVVEGFDGAGKSTFCATLVEAIRENGHEVMLVRQPGGTPLAEKIRDLHKGDTNGEPVSLLSEYLLMSAARQQLWVNRILPALNAGKVVITDRHTLSSYAYQGMLIPEVETEVSGPADLTVYLDVDFQVAMSRLAKKNEDCRIENKGETFLREVHRRYTKGYRELPVNRRVHIDTNRFSSEHYQSGVARAITESINLINKVAQVTAKAFEAQVYAVEGIRVIIRQDANLPITSYVYEPLPDTATLGDLTKRLRDHLGTIPHVVAASAVRDTIKVGFNSVAMSEELGNLRPNKTELSK